MTPNELDLTILESVKSYIAANPGCTAVEISRGLNSLVSTLGVTLYTRELRKQGLLESQYNGWTHTTTFYIVADEVEEEATEPVETPTPSETPDVTSPLIGVSEESVEEVVIPIRVRRQTEVLDNNEATNEEAETQESAEDFKEETELELEENTECPTVDYILKDYSSVPVRQIFRPPRDGPSP